MAIPNHTKFSNEYFYLIHAAGEAHDENHGAPLVEMLRAKPESVNVTGFKGRTPLMAACGAWGWEAGDWDPFDPIASKILIDRGANVNALDNDGCSALYYALTYGTDHIDNLLQAGANLEETLKKVLTMSRRGGGGTLMDIYETLQEYMPEVEPEEASFYHVISEYIVHWVRYRLPRYLDEIGEDPSSKFTNSMIKSYAQQWLQKIAD